VSASWRSWTKRGIVMNRVGKKTLCMP
jgi:hypothetical protein